MTEKTLKECVVEISSHRVMCVGLSTGCGCEAGKACRSEGNGELLARAL